MRRDLSNALIAAIMVAATVGGCGPRFTTKPGTDSYTAAGPGREIAVEAYLYDVRIRRDGKPTSLRLEMFQTDSVVALGGRGYLGKGALKGRLTADSVEVFFPTRHEYLYESVGDLLFMSDCTERIPNLDFTKLLRSLPRQEEYGDGLTIESDRSDRDRPRFKLTWRDCAWEMELTYDKRDDDWRLKEARFDDGAGVSFAAKRRAYKSSTKVGRNKFELPSERDYVRITP